MRSRVYIARDGAQRGQGRPARAPSRGGAGASVRPRRAPGDQSPECRVASRQLLRLAPQGARGDGEEARRDAREGRLVRHSGVKRNESHNANGQILHEIYFAILGGDGEAEEDLPVRARIEKDFGSFEAWQAELKAVAGQARGWAITCWDPSDARLHIYMTDGHDIGPVWGAQPILPLDVSEHAYYFDHGPNRAAYRVTRDLDAPIG